MRHVLVLVVALGCNYHPATGSLNNGDGGGDSNQLVDSSVDAPDDGPPQTGMCFGFGDYAICLASLPTSPLVLSSTSLATDSDECFGGAIISQTNGGQMCVYTGTTIDVTGTVTASGNLPLALIATGTITISGTLEVRSRNNANKGAGGNSSGCNMGTQGGSDSSGAGGGAGGSFGTVGANGAVGHNATGTGAAGAAGNPTAKPTVTRGGCRGSDGGSGTNGSGAGGDGGGAVYLATHGSITITGAIDASGGGADGGELNQGGGGGGGSGGMVSLFASGGISSASGTIFANGGGGGGGANTSSGQPGGAASLLVGGTGGGGGIATGTAGGAGATGTLVASTPLQSLTGGGGGGGGVGYIMIFSGQTVAGSFSPAPVKP